MFENFYLNEDGEKVYFHEEHGIRFEWMKAEDIKNKKSVYWENEVIKNAVKNNITYEKILGFNITKTSDFKGNKTYLYWIKNGFIRKNIVNNFIIPKGVNDTFMYKEWNYIYYIKKILENLSFIDNIKIGSYNKGNTKISFIENNKPKTVSIVELNNYIKSKTVKKVKKKKVKKINYFHIPKNTIDNILIHRSYEYMIADDILYAGNYKNSPIYYSIKILNHILNNDLKVKFIGFAISKSTEFNTKTKLLLELNGDIWNTTTIENFLRGYGNKNRGHSSIESLVENWNLNKKEIQKDLKVIKIHKNPNEYAVHTMLTVKCTKCDNIWDSSFKSLNHDEKQCDNCVAFKIAPTTQEEAENKINKICIDKNLTPHKFKYIGYYNTYIPLTCKLCGHSWNHTTYVSLTTTTNRHCIFCTKYNIPTQEEAEIILTQVCMKKNATYKNFLYNGSSSKLYLTCNKCNIDWDTASYSAFVNTDSGCPNCSEHGFKPNEPGYYYIHKIYNTENLHVGYKNGIANNLIKRYKQQLYKNYYKPEKYKSFFSAKGIHVQKLEKYISEVHDNLLYYFPKSLYEDGNTETFHKNSYDKIIKTVYEYIDKHNKKFPNEQIIELELIDDEFSEPVFG